LLGNEVAVRWDGRSHGEGAFEQGFLLAIVHGLGASGGAGCGIATGVTDLGAHGAVEAGTILQNASVPAARVSSARDLVEEDTQLAARGYWQTLEHPEMGPSLFTAPPFTIDGERVELRRPPLFGEHTQEVLTGLLGMSDAEIAELAERKILA
jgi:hypothetical protein